MNFFQHQENARKKTLWLALLFALAVVLIVLLSSLAVFFAFYQNVDLVIEEVKYDPSKFLLSAAAFLALIVAITLFKIFTFRSGGKAVAVDLGGVLIPQNSGDFKERRLLNIVQEMALASGIPVPPVYLIEESGINAFAAGTNFDNVVIGVTRGALENFDRDELQGVIAHEFSHVFNYDMRINLRIAGLLFGILFLAIIGRGLMRASSRSSYRRREKGDGAIVILGLSLLVIGYVGVLFANIIKAAISRQREFLADASAVQFTRNPQGIAAALKKIAASSKGSKFDNPKADEYNHMFFAQSMHGFFTSLFATHPPIEMRILAIDPSWDMQLPKEELPSKKFFEQKNVRDGTVKSFASIAGIAAAIDNIGNVNDAAIGRARELISRIPKKVLGAINSASPRRASAAIYGLLISDDEKIREKQLDILCQDGEEIYQICEDLRFEMSGLDEEFRLPIIDLAMPVLRQFSFQEYKNFKKNVVALSDADGNLDFFEWSLIKIIFKNLDREFSGKYLEKKAIYEIKDSQKEIALFLSLMAYCGADDFAKAKEAFDEAKQVLGFDYVEIVAKDQVNFEKIEEAVADVELLKPLAKREFLRACNVCIHYHGVTSSELEMFRAFAVILDCPVGV